MEHYSLT